MPDGTRVRHSGHRYSKAYRDGTATVVRHFWRGVWLEYVVLLDEDIRYIGKDTAEWSADCTVKM